MKGLEFITQTLQEVQDCYNSYYEVKVNEDYLECFNTAYKDLKALDIIRRYPFEVASVYAQPTYKDYCQWFSALKDGKPKLTEEQYNLLREVLKC